MEPDAVGQSRGRGDEEKGGASRGYIGARMATSKTQTSPWERSSVPRQLRTSLPHAEWLRNTRTQELQRERMVPSKRYRSLDLTRKSESVACRTPTLSESPPSLDTQERRGGGTPTLNRVVDGSPRGVALGAKNCLDDSKRESRDTRVPGSAVFQGRFRIGNVMMHGPGRQLQSFRAEQFSNRSMYAGNVDKEAVCHFTPCTK